ncbi:MAG: glycosyltransferase [Thermodesulfobacteriota bacterium]
MIKVLHIVEDLKIGGLERVVENIAMHLGPERFEVYVLCLTRGGEVAERLIENGRPVEILGINNYHSIRSLLKVAGWIRGKKADIVHTHGYPAGVLGRLAAIIIRTPAIFHHVHSTYFDLNKRNHLIERFLSLFTNKIICCSKAVKRFIEETEGISIPKIEVIYNGVPEPETLNSRAVNTLKKEMGIPQDVRVIGCVASLTPHKGHRFLLDAFKKIDNACLLLIGDGPQRDDLERTVLELGIGKRVIFAGCKADVSPYMQIMDMIVLPSSEREGLGISLIEAMALSKPVVATNIGGVPEVVDDGITGILVKPGDSNTLSDAINRLLNSQDLMHSMGQNGRERYLKIFTQNRMLKGIEGLYGD